MKSSRLIEYADGSAEVVDAIELYKIAESFAATYGLGGCKTLSEFVRMIDEEDPSVLNGFITANGIRTKAIQDETPSRPSKTYIPNTPESKGKKKEPDEVIKVSNRNTLTHFLKKWGANKDQIKDAIADIDSGKIKVSKNDYSHITSETLLDPNFDFDGTLKMMSEDTKNAVKINIGWDTLNKKQRESNGGRK